MSDALCVSFRFLSPIFHGRGDGGAPEWPPSPLRAFQALVASAARLGSSEQATPALEWLEQLPPPVIVAPAAQETLGYRLSVPNNSMDVIARNWSRGGDANPAGQRAMKDVRPLALPEGEAAVVHFVWSSAEFPRAHVETIVRLARSVVALGWGIDLVAGFGALISATERTALVVAAEEWASSARGRVVLRTPRAGTLKDLERRHQAFLRRTSLSDANTAFSPPPPLSEFSSTGYSRAGDPVPAQTAAFTLMHPGEDRFRSFDTVSRGAVVAGNLRDAVRRSAERAGWDETTVRSVILGHAEPPGAEPSPVLGRRLLLIPLPTPEPREKGERIESIRRVLLVSTDTNSSDISWVRRALSGQTLRDERSGQTTAILAEAPRGDRTVSRYAGAASTWTTVTPVVLPGLDDPGGLRKKLASRPTAAEQKVLLTRLTQRREGLVRKAMRQAGLSDELVFHADVEVREVGFLAGVEPARRYRVPSHLSSFPRLHVRVRWRTPTGEPALVSGPLCLGRGRFSGMGLLVSLAD